MSVSKSQVDVLWAGASSKSVASLGNATSDAFSLASNAVAAQIQVEANNGGTPVSGDTIDCWILFSLDDSLYDSTNQAAFLMRLDTNGQNPAVLTVPIPASWKSAKLYVVSNASQAITVSAKMLQTTVS